MTLRSCLGLALIAGALGAFIGRAVPRDAPRVQAATSASSASSTAVPPGSGCKAERADLASTKTQLTICMAFRTPVPGTDPSGIPEIDPSGVPELAELELPESDPRLPTTEEIREYRERLDSYPEAVIVQHYDGATGVYKPDEWPTDGDGIIVARKLPNGRLAWYAGSDAGPRSDPAAFRTSDSPNITQPVMRRELDGTITIDGKPASPGVQFMFGGKVDETATPEP